MAKPTIVICLIHLCNISSNLKTEIFNPSIIDFNQQPCLLTGVNMGGKTVLLKTIGLSQYLFQFGFYVPASSAIISSVEKNIY